MVISQCQDAGVFRRMCVAAAVALLAAACSGGDAEPVDLGTSVSAAPSSSTTEARDEPGEAVLPTSASVARPITADDGSFPEHPPPRSRSAQLPTEQVRWEQLATVSIGGGRIWVPWPQYSASQSAGELVVAGSQSALVDDIRAGMRYVADQRRQWDAMPPYLQAAQEAFAQGSRVARRRAGTGSAWELVIDPTDVVYETRLAADRSAAYDHAELCPPHPTPETLGVDAGDSVQQRSQAAAVVEAFILGMRSPGGRPMHSWGTTVNEIAKLLAYSPGEPMELALGGHSLTDAGFFPGDWSEQAKAWLTRRAAQGAVTGSLVGHAAVSRGPATLWEACSDLATIIPGVYTASYRTRKLESLWARGLRLEFTTPPVERAWVADLSAAGHALAVICHAPGQSFLVDASTGERLDAGVDHRAQVEALWLTWSRLSYRALRNALFEGDCDSEAFARATQWLADEKDALAATVDWSEPRAWGSGVRSDWVTVREWVEVPQREAWQAHRDHSWHLAYWCEIGIPNGALVDGVLQKPELKPHCSSEQWSALAEAAAAAPAVTSELSATIWEPGASWHERMYLSPFKSLDEVLGCPADPDLIGKALARPIERRVKKPWPPGSLPFTPPDRAYPRPVPPCPSADWPPQTDRFWWPTAEPLGGQSAVPWADERDDRRARRSAGATS